MSKPIVVKFDERYTDSGATSRRSWQSEDVKLRVRQLFNTSPSEIITGIELDATGITARFVFEREKAGNG